MRLKAQVREGGAIRGISMLTGVCRVAADSTRRPRRPARMRSALAVLALMDVLPRWLATTTDRRSYDRAVSSSASARRHFVLVIDREVR